MIKNLQLLNQEQIIREIKPGHIGKLINHNFEDCVKKSWKNLML